MLDQVANCSMPGRFAVNWPERKREPMPETVTNELIYEVLKSVQAQVSIIREDVSGLKNRISSLQSSVAGLHADMAEVSARLDRLESRVERVENQLNLYDTHH